MTRRYVSSEIDRRQDVMLDVKLIVDKTLC